MDVVLIENNKRGAKLCYAGYMYTKTSVRKNKIWWKCSKRTALKCCGSVSTTLDSKNPVPRILHNHGPEEAEIEYSKFRNTMRKKRTEERKNKIAGDDYSGIDNIINHNDDDNGDSDVLQQQQQMVDVLNNQRNTMTNINKQKRNLKFLQPRRRKKENSQNSAKDLLESRSRFISSMLNTKGPNRQAPIPMGIQRLNQPMKSMVNKRQQHSENGQNLFPHLQMNLLSNANAKGQGIKRPAPISIEAIELEDIKPNKRQLDTQNLIQMEHTHSQVTTGHHTYPQVTSAQQSHMQLQINRQNHLQMIPNTQSSTVIQNPPGHSPITIVSQNHPRMPTGQMNHQASVSQHSYSKTSNAGHPNPFQVPTSQPSHMMTTGKKNHSNITVGHSNPHQMPSSQPSQKNHSNITVGHSNPHQMPSSQPSQKNHSNITVGHSNPHQMPTSQPMIPDQQSQPQNSVGHQKFQQLSPVQLRLLETSPARPNRIEVVSSGQQKNETIQESLKSAPEAPESHLKQSSKPDTTCSSSGSKLSSIPQRNKKTFTVSKHQHTVMSSLALLWKDSKLCDATIGNGNFKIMVHKVILLAISPTLLSQADIKANCFIRVNLPEEVSKAALVAFSEYMYHGVLTLDPALLQQLRIIALQLGIRELELLCDTHLLYCDLQDSVTDSSLNLPETSLLRLPSEASQRLSSVPEFITVKQEGICEELKMNSSQPSVKDIVVPIKKEPLDDTSDSSALKISNISPSPNVNVLSSAKYKQANLEMLVLGGQYNDPCSPVILEFESPGTSLHQGASDCLSELNDILQLQKFFKKSDLSSNFSLSEGFDKSTISLSPNSSALQGGDLIDFASADSMIQQNYTEQSKNPPFRSTSRRTSQSLEVLKETADMRTFQITDVRSVQPTIDII